MAIDHMRGYLISIYIYITDCSYIKMNQMVSAIVGTSGIGKSSFFLYFIIRLLSTSAPPIVLTMDGILYAFGGMATLRLGTFMELPPFTWPQ